MYSVSTPPRTVLDPWRAGDEWINPVTGVRLWVEESAAQTDGQRAVWRVTFPPASPEPPDHFHPAQAERFTGLEGTVRIITTDGGLRELTAHEELVIAPRQVHRMWNPHPAPATVRWEMTPALQSERWMAMMIALAQAGRTNRRGIPSLLQLAVLLHTFRAELRLARPAPFLQAAIFGPLAAVGRMNGLRADRV